MAETKSTKGAIDSMADIVPNSLDDMLGLRPAEIKTYHSKPYPRLAPEKSTFNGAGKTVLITAGATGIGYAISESFCKTGISHLILIQRRESVLAEAKQALTSAYPSVKITTYAASAGDHVRMAEIISAASRIDVLVPCATSEALGAAIDLTADQIDEMLHTNVTAPHRTIAEFLKLPSSGPRSVIYVSSAATQVAVPNQSSYRASKAAGNQIVGHFALEHPGDVKFYAMHPGVIYTPMVSSMASEDTMAWEDVQVPGDFAVWLASPEAEFLNGRYVWAEWDVDELIGMKKRIEENPSLLMTTVVV